MRCFGKHIRASMCWVLKGRFDPSFTLYRATHCNKGKRFIKDINLNLHQPFKDDSTRVKSCIQQSVLINFDIIRKQYLNLMLVKDYKNNFKIFFVYWTFFKVHNKLIMVNWCAKFKVRSIKKTFQKYSFRCIQ